MANDERSAQDDRRQVPSPPVHEVDRARAESEAYARRIRAVIDQYRDALEALPDD